MSPKILSLLACLVLSSPAFCADPETPPAKTIRFNVSTDTVSALTEIPAGDYLVPDSQIFVGGRGGASRWLALLGVVIDNARNQSAASTAADRLRIKFDVMFTEALTALDARGAIPEAKFSLSPSPYDAKLLPGARFQVEDDGRAYLTFRLTIRVREEPGSSEVTRNYHYPVLGLHPLTGEGSWTDNDAELLRTAAKVAMEQLALVFASDLAGRFDEARLPGKQRVVTMRAPAGMKPNKSVLLAEMNQKVVVVPILRTRPIWGVLQILDGSSVDPGVPVELQ